MIKISIILLILQASVALGQCTHSIYKSYLLSESKRAIEEYDAQIDSNKSERGLVFIYKYYWTDNKSEYCHEALFFIFSKKADRYSSFRDVFRKEQVSYLTKDDSWALPSFFTSKEPVVYQSNNFEKINREITTLKKKLYYQVSECEYVQVIEADLIFDEFKGTQHEYYAFNPIYDDRKCVPKVFFREVKDIKNAKSISLRFISNLRKKKLNKDCDWFDAY